MTNADHTVIPSRPDPITITEEAASKVASLIDEEGNLALKLRAFITGGGCSGFQYGFTFTESVNADDTLVTKSLQTPANPAITEVTFVIDAMSQQYLEGATVDYKQDLQGERFVITNPNAVTTCGCGSSFSA